MQASLEDLMETQPSLSDAFLNRLFALLNWTLTEFTISTQVPISLPVEATCTPSQIVTHLTEKQQDRRALHVRTLR